MAAFNFPASPSNGDTYTLNSVTYQYDGTKWVRYSASVGAQGAAGSDATIGNNADNRVITGTGSANTLNAESNVHIDGSGRLMVGTTTEGHAAADNLTVADSGNSGITIRSGTTNNGTIYFSDGTSGTAEYKGAVRYTHSDNSLGFYANGSEKFSITSDGEVLKPSNPAFIAGRTGGNATFTLGTFPFNVARLNVGNCYSTSTYKFTAPVAGVYYFFAQVYYNNGNGNYRVGFRKTPSGGSAFMLNTAAHSMVGNDNSNTTSLIESLAVGDTVELYSDQNASVQCYYNINDTTYGNHTYFMGYLIG